MKDQGVQVKEVDQAQMPITLQSQLMIPQMMMVRYSLA